MFSLKEGNLKKTILFLSIILVISSATLAVSNHVSASNNIAVTIEEVSPFAYCCIKHKGPYTDMEKIINLLMPTMKSQNIYPQGPMISIYYNSPDEVEPAELEWEVGFPVTAQALPQIPLEKKLWEHKLVAVATHVGPYETTGETITSIYEWMEANNYEQDGPILGKFLSITSPDATAETTKTEIWIACKKSKTT